MTLTLIFFFFLSTGLQINEHTHLTDIANNANCYDASNFIEQNDSFFLKTFIHIRNYAKIPF